MLKLFENVDEKALSYALVAIGCLLILLACVPQQRIAKLFALVYILI